MNEPFMYVISGEKSRKVKKSREKSRKKSGEKSQENSQEKNLKARKKSRKEKSSTNICTAHTEHILRHPVWQAKREIVYPA